MRVSITILGDIISIHNLIPLSMVNVGWERERAGGEACKIHVKMLEVCGRSKTWSNFNLHTFPFSETKNTNYDDQQVEIWARDERERKKMKRKFDLTAQGSATCERDVERITTRLTQGFCQVFWKIYSNFPLYREAWTWFNLLPSPSKPQVCEIFRRLLSRCVSPFSMSTSSFRAITNWDEFDSNLIGVNLRRMEIEFRYMSAECAIRWCEESSIFDKCDEEENVLSDQIQVCVRNYTRNLIAYARVSERGEEKLF